MPQSTRPIGRFDRQPPLFSGLLELVEQFDSQSRDSIEVKAGDEMKDAIDSIVNNKNALAHGQNSGLGLETMRDYYQRAVRLIAIVEREFH